LIWIFKNGSGSPIIRDRRAYNAGVIFFFFLYGFGFII